MHNHQRTAALVKAECDPAILFVPVGEINERQRLGITEHRRGTLKTGAMVAQIVLGFPGDPTEEYTATSHINCGMSWC